MTVAVLQVVPPEARSVGSSRGVATGWGTFMGSSGISYINTTSSQSCGYTQVAMDMMQDKTSKTTRMAYFTAMAPTRDSKILNPSVPPSSGSLDRSGCGIIPSTLRPSLQIPAILSRDPLGLASAVMSPAGEQ
jgi:hypothetical protein